MYAVYLQLQRQLRRVVLLAKLPPDDRLLSLNAGAPWPPPLWRLTFFLFLFAS
jgi:hypothetical protein